MKLSVQNKVEVKNPYALFENLYYDLMPNLKGFHLNCKHTKGKKKPKSSFLDRPNFFVQIGQLASQRSWF